jgi:SdrD B-like domain
MTTELYCRRSTLTLVLQRVVLCLTGIAMMTMLASAQQRYSYLPTASVTDGRFFSVAGSGIFTLGDNVVSFKVSSPEAATSVEIGIFDGETGGYWDQGSISLQYTLYADPANDATGTTQVAQWLGSTMADNAWTNLTVNNVAAAKSTAGDYFYLLRVRSVDPAQFSWSSFKIRTNGTLAGLRNTAFGYTAPLGNANDASVVYPAWPNMSGARYNGDWAFFLDVTDAPTSITLWDGDMDRGSFDCSDNDNDDPDTPNNSIPSFAAGSAAVAEGLAGNGVACVDATGAPTTGMTTSNPPDNSRVEALRRGTGVSYELVLPNNTRFANTNPSGNLEWEEFTVSTAPFNRAEMDFHADALPVGIYRLQISGVDMSNLNAWRFPYDFLGVDTTGVPVEPPPAEPPPAPPVNGAITGTVFFDANNNSTQDVGEPGIGSAKVFLAADYDVNGTVDNTTSVVADRNGKYRFNNLRGGKYNTRIDTTTIPSSMIPTTDADGLGSRHNATVTLTAAQPNKTMNYGYMPFCAPGTATRGYWRNHPEAWPVSSLVLGGRTYSKNDALAILGKATAGDKTYSLAAQLIATKLNLMMGNMSGCIGAYVEDADEWLEENRVGHGCSSRDWSSISRTHEKLDDYNNGELCVPHRDDVECGNNHQPPPPKNCRTRYNRHDNDDDDNDYYRGCRRRNHRHVDRDDDDRCNGRMR